jgi:hypothetical protein
MLVLEQERLIMELSEAHAFAFRVIGVAPPPTKTVYYNDWRLVPLAEDTSNIPARAVERLRTIYEAGIIPKAVIIGHELPPHPSPLPSPSTPQAELPPWPQLQPPNEVSMPTREATSSGIAPVLAPLAAVVAGACTILPTLFPLLLAGALLDPCLLVVTEDNVWIQIDFWADEE